MDDPQKYVTLVTSLPKLERFDRAKRLPINPQRLRERMSMLDREDRDILRQGVNLMAWQRQPLERTDEEMVDQYDRMREDIGDRPLWRLFQLTADVRTIMAGLRRRKRGLPAPGPGERWGLGRWVKPIERNWSDPDFRLSFVFSWIPRARQLMAKGNALELDRLLMGYRWDRLSYMTADSLFGFEAVLAYLFKWDMMQRWLAYDVDKAKVRFDELVAEAIDEGND